MAILIQRGLPCPFCSSSDAYAEYDTNFYCFSCREGKSKQKRSRTPASLVKQEPGTLPRDCTKDLPLGARASLYQFHFTDELIEKAKIMYSDSGEIYSQRLSKNVDTGNRLILPYYQEDKLVYWEGKATSKNSLKYITMGGKQQVYKTFIGKVDTVVVVEDILSAIRVGTTFPCIALRGTSCNTSKLDQLRKSADSFIVWLDGDRPGINAAKKLGNKLTWVGKVCYIRTKEDPKAYSNEEIQEMIDEVLIQTSN